MSSAKKFYNFSSEDFVGTWDKVDYLVKAGESIMLPGFLADHLAHHLVTREMFREGKITETNSKFARQPYVDKCFVEDEIEAVSELEAEVKALNQVKEVKEVKKAGRPKKEVTKEFDEVL